MTDQLNIFNQAEAQRLGTEGMQKAARAARVQAWKLEAATWLSQQSGLEIIADDLVKAIGLPDHGVARNNVVGAWFSAQSKLGTIEFAGRLRKSARTIGHSNLQRVWRVL